MRLQDRPTFRAGAAVAFDDFLAGARAVRAVAQAGLYPVESAPGRCRRMRRERRQRRQLRAARAGLRVRRSSGRRLAGARARAGAGSRRPRCCRMPAPPRPGGPRSSACRISASCWCRCDLIVDTFETAITWDRFEAFHARSRRRPQQAIRRGDRQARPGHLPLHPRLSGRPGALLLLPRRGSPGRAARAVAAHQGAGVGCA